MEQVPGITDGYVMLNIDMDLQLILISLISIYDLSFACCLLVFCALVESSTHYMFEII